jgi:hypothetical protein
LTGVTVNVTSVPWQIAVDGEAEILTVALAAGSVTVTVAIQVSILLLLSVTVKVTEFVPTFPQLNSNLEAVTDAIPQLSVDVLLICDIEMDALPELSKVTETFLHFAIGLVVSLIVKI